MRRWRYFFSKSLSPDSNPEEFCRALRAFTFNACFSDKAEEVILPTSKFLEQLAAENLDDERYPHGTTLFASLQNGSNLLDELRDARKSPPHYLDERTILADWSQLYDWSHRSEAESERVERLENMLPREVIRNHLKKEEFREVPLNLPKGNLDKAGEEAEGYKRALIDTFENKEPPPAAYLLRGCSTSEHGQRIEGYFNEHPDESEKLTQYVAWIHDVACGRTGGLITIPAWFPGANTGGRSGALILGLREETQLSPGDFSGLISTFRMGSTSVAMEDQRERGREEGEERGRKKSSLEFAHQVKHISFALSSKWLVEPNEKEKKAIGELDTPPDWSDTSWEVVPFPGLIESTGRLISLWCQLTNPEQLFDRKPDNIKGLVRGCWKLAKDSIKPRLLHGYDVKDKTGQVTALMREVDEMWRDLFTVSGPDTSYASSVRPDWENEHSREVWMQFTRLLIASLGNCVRHAHPQKEVSVDIEQDEEEFRLEIKNYQDDEESSISGSIQQARSRVGMLPLAGNRARGHDIINIIAEDLSEDVVFGSSRVEDNPYFQNITLPIRILK